ncbi:pectate lyase-like adhesive domain-containing protein [Clostridium sp. K04]|uniref:pectate lyase-like adhesive domain-containing protein n=1 Tax=Clostridium sp. K04 TaxID=2718929 RepID=UPI001C8C2B76|nr:pectate lyase-like adhesive domain-containing protein [Clostridium sp. K04]MBX9183394.1 DUF5011 domain-containing protein [Clostridium sp. K04]
MENIKSENHKYSGIRVKNGSTLTLKGTNTHKNDKVDVQNITKTGENPNKIDDVEKQYLEIGTTQSDSNTTSGVVTTTTTNYRAKVVNVETFDELKNAITVANSVVNITKDITLTDNLNIIKENITINGNGNKLDLNNTTNKVVVKSTATGTVLNNLKVVNYEQIGIAVDNAKDVTLDTVEVIGTPNKSTVGIDLAGATVKINNIKSENHKEAGIRVRKQSTVTFEGRNVHKNDKFAVKDVVLNTEGENKILGVTEQYIQTSETTETDKKNTFYSFREIINVNNFTELEAAVAVDNSIINIKSDIKLDEELIITGKNITFNGEGRNLDLSTGKKITVKQAAEGTKLSDININNYGSQAIFLYKTNNITLENINLTGDGSKSLVAIDLNGSTDIKIENVTSTNHKTVGIRLGSKSSVDLNNISLTGVKGQNSTGIELSDSKARMNAIKSSNHSCVITLKNESDVEFVGGNTHTDDKEIIKVVVATGEKPSAIKDDTNQYLQTSQGTQGGTGTQEIYYGFFETKEVNTVDELITAVSQSNRIINLNQDIELKEELQISGQNVIINGNNRTITLAEGKKITIKSTATGSKISKVKIKGYTSQGLLVYNAKNITLEDIELIGDGAKSSVGLDIALDSTVKIQNIITSNHKQSGILVRDGAEVELLGGNKHTNDVDDLISLVNNGKNNNKIIDKTNQYNKTDEKKDASGNVREYYNIRKVENVTTFEQLKKAVELKNVAISIAGDITFTENLDISKSSVTIYGNNHKFDLANTYSFKVSGKDTTLEEIEITNYKTTGLSVYTATNTTLKKVKLTGKSIDLPKEERSTVGVDIYKSTVKIDEISSSNNLYRGIQVRGESTVEILSKNVYTNDTVHMQTIKEKNEKDSTIIDNQGLYVHGTEKDSNGKATVDYFSRVDVNIKTAEDFVKNISNNGNVLHINNDITIDENALSILGSDVSELEVSSNITIEGQGNVIDLNKLASITLKGNDIVLKDLTVRNSTDIGVNIYNSRDILLDTVNIENSTRYGIFVNGSTVNLKDCSTKDNNSGIMITRSRTLRGDKDIDSRVEVIGSIKQEESNINVGVTNLEMLDGHFQKNEFIVPNGIYNKYENDMEEKVLSEYYLNLFGITGEERNKKYKEQTTDYMIIQTVINAKENTEVKNPDGTYVRLAGDGVTDDTENLKKLIEYAASHGREIYFPEGIYKITDDIDLSTINLPALSNFTLSGDKDGQRRDHIIYSKGYKNLNIYGNYFKGMENGAAGGLKIRNGENAYIGSNHFYDVPVLTYIYGDLTQEECILYNTTIYNNLFHQVTNFGGQGTGILYYQSFRDGDDLSFKVTNADGTTGTNTWNDAFGDVQNFVIYKNQFLSDDRDQITISGRAQQAYKNGEFIASGNTYVEKDITVGYNSGNLTLTESTEDYALSKVNDGYSKYKDVEIPLAPATVDYKYLNEEINKANSFYDKIVNENLIGILGGQYPEEAVNELKDLISETEELIKTNSLNQWETNSRLTLIQETLEKLKASVNDKGESPVVDEITNITIEVGNTFDPMDGIVITDDRDTIDDLKVNVDLGNFDNNTPGKYIIKYTVEDRDGNITVVEREVTVIGEDEANKDESNKDESNKDEIK